MEEQTEIAQSLRQIDRKIKAETIRGNALEALFRSLLHHLMTGKVRVNDLDLPTSAEAASCP
jgi:type I restriction enzyme, S subunit